MTALVVLVVCLVALGSVLALAEASISRMTKAKAMALVAEEQRNATLLARIENDPPTYLNPIYLAVMLVQNGSAVLVTLIGAYSFDGFNLILLSAAFTLAYFVVVEAMSKTFGIQHATRVALAVSPLVVFLGRILSYPTRLLIGLANVLLPGKGLKSGPFVSEEEIRSLAEVGHEEGMIEEHEKELIHSIFEFGDTVVREVMVPRPDIVAVEATETLRAVQETVLKHGVSRIPVYRDEIDHIEGVLYVKDLLRALHQGRESVPLPELARKAHFTPESKPVSDLLRDMQRDKFHMALVTDEYGSVVGLVTLEDLLEELVGEIADEHDLDEPQLIPVGDGTYRANGRLAIAELNELLDVELPREEWDTVAGLMLGLLGAIPREGQSVTCQPLSFTAEKVKGLRVDTVLIHRGEPAAGS
jgi:CBS domain containing-hemolysin-like protein